MTSKKTAVASQPSDLAWMRPKLAELEGFVLGDDEQCLPYYINLKTRRSISVVAYRPDEDVAQAVRCLEAMHAYLSEIHRYDEAQDTLKMKPLGRWMCCLRYIESDRRNATEYGDTLPRAICLAMAAALGWEAPPDAALGWEAPCE